MSNPSPHTNQLQHQSDSSASSKISSSHVGPDDVLLGRGGRTNAHRGNVQFRGIVASHTIKYLQAKKLEKSKIAEAVVETIYKNGGRFLQRAPRSKSVKEGVSSITDEWVPVPHQRAVAKTCQALRENLDVRNGSFKIKSLGDFRKTNDLVSVSAMNSARASVAISLAGIGHHATTTRPFATVDTATAATPSLSSPDSPLLSTLLATANHSNLLLQQQREQQQRDRQLLLQQFHAMFEYRNPPLSPSDLLA